MIEKLKNYLQQRFFKKDQTKTNLHKSASVDFGDIQKDIFKSRELYKQLIRKVHPDRFPDLNKKNIAEDIAKRIVQSKHSYSQLLTLKEEAQSSLDIELNV